LRKAEFKQNNNDELWTKVLLLLKTLIFCPALKLLNEYLITFFVLFALPSNGNSVNFEVFVSSSIIESSLG